MLSYESKTLDIAFLGLGEMFEGDSADTCGGKFPIVSIGGQAECFTCVDPGARTPIGSSGFFSSLFLDNIIKTIEGVVLSQENLAWVPK